MRRMIFICAAALLCMMSSCSKADMEVSGPGELISLIGLVVDENSVPVNHIKVTAEWDSKDSPIEAYSSSKGIFMQSVSKVVFMEKDDSRDEILSIPTYQLNHATASESNQQFL